MKKFLSSFWGLFLVLFTVVLLGANTPILVKGLSDSSWSQVMRLVAPFKQITNLGNQQMLIETGNKNMLIDPSFEGSTVLWTEISANLNPAYSTNQKYSGAKSLQFDVNNVVGQNGISPSVQLTGAFLEAGHTISFSFKVKMIDNDAGNLIQLRDCTFGNTLGNINQDLSTLPDGGAWQGYEFTWITDGTVTCLEAYVETGNDTEWYVDDMYIGEWDGIGSVAQATYFGGMENAGASTCKYLESTSTGVTDFDALGTGTSCAAWTVDAAGLANGLSTQGTNDHRLVATNMPPGEYMFELSGQFESIVSSSSCRYALSDGTNLYQKQSVGETGTPTILSPLLKFHVTKTTTSTVTWTIVAADQSTSCGWSNVADTPASWKIYRFPSQSEQVVRMSQTNFDWTTCPSISGTWSSNTSYTCKWKRQGSDAWFDVKVATSGTPTSANLSLNLPITIDTSKLSSTDTFKSFETTGMISDSDSTVYQAKVTYSSTTAVLVKYLSSTAQTTQVTQAAPFSFGSGDYVSLVFKVPVSGWMENQNAPLIAGGVTSDSSSVGVIGAGSFYTTAWGTVCSAASCTMTADTTAGWTIVRSTTGQYKVLSPKAYASGFSCTVHVATTGTAFATSVPQTGNSTTEYFFVTKNAAGTNVDTYGSFTCFGGRP